MTRLLLAVMAVFVLAGCTVPKIIVIKDPLTPAEHNTLGITYERQGELKLAMKEYRRAADKADGWAVPLFNLGNVHASMQEWEQAEKAYEKALKIDPGNPVVLNNLAWTKAKLGRMDEAETTVRKAIAAAPDEPTYLETYLDILTLKR